MFTALVLFCAINTAGQAELCETRINAMEFFRTENECMSDLFQLAKDPRIQDLMKPPGPPIMMKEVRCVKWDTNTFVDATS